MLTKKDKNELIDILKSIDVKKMSIDHDNKEYEKWFRFGSYNGLQIASEIIKQLPEPAKKTQKINVD